MRRSSHLHLTRLARALLDRKDWLSMAVGLEVRVPFADHHLVQYVYNTPWSMKNEGGREKYLLRAAVAQMLPRSVVVCIKSPYPITQDVQYVQAVQQQVNDVLGEPCHSMFDVFDQSWVRRTVAQDPTTATKTIRNGLEPVLDMYHWLDIYRPELRLD